MLHQHRLQLGAIVHVIRVCISRGFIPSVSGKSSLNGLDYGAEGLQRVAVATGRPQAELIREGVRRVIAEVEKQPRAFRSMAKGRGKGKPYAPWKATDLYRKVMGR